MYDDFKYHLYSPLNEDFTRPTEKQFELHDRINRNKEIDTAYRKGKDMSRIYYKTVDGGHGFTFHPTPGTSPFKEPWVHDKEKFHNFISKSKADPSFKNRFFKQKNLIWNMKGGLGEFLNDKVRANFG